MNPCVLTTDAASAVSAATLLLDDRGAIRLSSAVCENTAGTWAAPPQARAVTGSIMAGTGSTQYVSPHVRTLLAASAVVAWVVPAKPDALRMPHDARILVENGTGTRCVRSITESTSPP